MGNEIPVRQMHKQLKLANQSYPGFASAYIEFAKGSKISLDGDFKVLDEGSRRFQTFVDVVKKCREEENFANAFGLEVGYNWDSRKIEISISDEHKVAAEKLTARLEAKGNGLSGKIKEILGVGKKDSFVDGITNGGEISR